MNKRAVIFAFSIWGIIILVCLLSVVINITNAVSYTISFNKTETIEENIKVREISQKIGVEPSWLAIRDHIYCKSLHKGMSKSEVENLLSNIAEIKVFESQIVFTDITIDTKLGPIEVDYDNGRLSTWRRSSTENLGQPLAECEKTQ